MTFGVGLASLCAGCGEGTTLPPPNDRAVSVSLAQGAACVVLEDGRLLCTGDYFANEGPATFLGYSLRQIVRIGRTKALPARRAWSAGGNRSPLMRSRHV